MSRNPKQDRPARAPKAPAFVPTGPDADLIQQWMNYLATVRNRSQRTQETYRLAVVRLMEFLGGKALADAEAGEIEAFAGMYLHKLGVVARSRKPYISGLRMFYAWMHRTGHVRSNPAAGLVHPNIGRPLPIALTLAEAEKLMWAPDLNTFRGIRDATIFALLIACGLRVSGLVALNDSHLSTEEIDKKLRLVVNVVEKGGRERRLPLPREAEMLLRIYMEHDQFKATNRDTVNAKGKPDKVLFITTQNPRVQAHERHGEALRLTRKSVWDKVQTYGKRAGIPDDKLHPHAFRHLFGTELAEDEQDIITRQHLMGHADPKSTAIYTEMSMRRKARVMDTAGPLGKMKTPVSEVLRRLPPT
jgi:integrase/recombinase XerD